MSSTRATPPSPPTCPPPQIKPHRHYERIKVHTAKCDTCNGRNVKGDLWRCRDCGWSVCEACRLVVVVDERTRAREMEGPGDDEEGGGGEVDGWHSFVDL